MEICPEISSGIVFVEEEWKVLCCCARKSKEIPESYSLKEAIYDLGVLGGTKGAPSDGMPGVRSIWQGLDVLYSLLAYRNYLVSIWVKLRLCSLCKMPKIKKYQNCKNDVYQPDEKGYPQTVFSHSICYRVNRKTVVDNTSEKL